MTQASLLTDTEKWETFKSAYKQHGGRCINWEMQKAIKIAEQHGWYSGWEALIPFAVLRKIENRMLASKQNFLLIYESGTDIIDPKSGTPLF
jgi:hypothetical protein